MERKRLLDRLSVSPMGRSNQSWLPEERLVVRFGRRAFSFCIATLALGLLLLVLSLSLAQAAYQIVARIPLGLGIGYGSLDGTSIAVNPNTGLAYVTNS